MVNATDIDLLYVEVNAATNNTFYDLTNDDQVTTADVDELVWNILGTQYGDANLDAKVSLLDLDTLGQNYGQMAGWREGDFSGNGQVSLQDLDLLGQNYGFGVGAEFSTPVPSASAAARSIARSRTSG